MAFASTVSRWTIFTGPCRDEKPSILRRLAWHIRECGTRWQARRIGKILDAENADVVNTHNVLVFRGWKEVKRPERASVHIAPIILMCRATLFRMAALPRKDAWIQL